MTGNLSDYISTEEISVVQAMQKIDRGAKGILFIVDDRKRLIGCVTDGDIRRWLIRTGDMNARASLFMFKKPRYLFVSDLIDPNVFMEENSINALPILDINHRIINICFRFGDNERNHHNNSSLNDVPVVIMAGGKGTRLYPFTKILPKPLIPIGEIPILERIIDRFVDCGVTEFYLTVNYKKGMIKSYFEDLNPDYQVYFVEENEPLGTGGSLKLIEKKFDRPLIVTNCDTLIDANLSDIYRRHLESGNVITVVAALKNTLIPYGVLKVKEDGIVEEIQEKPSLSNFINTGLYIMNPELLGLIPDHAFYHMTNLIDDCMSKGLQVGMYPVSEEAFLDMGEFEEMKRMEKKLNV